MVEHLLYLFSIPGPSAHPQYLVPPSGTQRPSLSDFDLPAVDMGGFSSTFDGIQRASWEATCAPDDDVSVPQPQHLSTNNSDPRCSKRSVRKQRRGTDLKAASSVMGQAGVPNTASQPRKTRKKFTPEEDALLIRLKVIEEKNGLKSQSPSRGELPAHCKLDFARGSSPNQPTSYPKEQPHALDPKNFEDGVNFTKLFKE
ncbi:hypothetical protein FPRO04_12231 [Fusarium proliferatum]|nr:hypothetical protein FPRO04_12231 [Fusarium proliferatum]